MGQRDRNFQPKHERGSDSTRHHAGGGHRQYHGDLQRRQNKFRDQHITRGAASRAERAGRTSTALTLSSGTVAVGSSVTLTAKVSAGTSTPPDGETVTFENVTKTPPTALGTGKLSKGTATFTSTAIPAGTYSVVASYPGDANFLPSTSTPAQTLDVQSFTLSASPTTVTVSAPGQSGSTTITIATLGNLKASSVTGFACSAALYLDRAIDGHRGQEWRV